MRLDAPTPLLCLVRCYLYHLSSPQTLTVSAPSHIGLSCRPEPHAQQTISLTWCCSLIEALLYCAVPLVLVRPLCQCEVVLHLLLAMPWYMLHHAMPLYHHAKPGLLGCHASAPCFVMLACYMHDASAPPVCLSLLSVLANYAACWAVQATSCSNFLLPTCRHTASLSYLHVET